MQFIYLFLSSELLIPQSTRSRVLFNEENYRNYIPHVIIFRRHRLHYQLAGGAEIDMGNLSFKDKNKQQQKKYINIYFEKICSKMRSEINHPFVHRSRSLT